MIRLLIIPFLFFAMSGCAPMPGPHLFPGLTEPTPLDQVSVNIVTGPIDASVACNGSLADEGKYGLIALNCLTNGCFVLGCARVYWSQEGKVYQCDVYAAFDAGWIINHELEHCKGYADKLYN